MFYHKQSWTRAKNKKVARMEKVRSTSIINPREGGVTQWLKLLAIIGLVGCAKEKVPSFAPPPAPKVDGTKVTF